MQFDIIVRVDGKRYQMQVKRIYEGENNERFIISGGEKSVVFQSDYHYLKKIKSRKNANCKVISGEVKNGVAFALSVKEIELHFKNDEDKNSYERKK